MMNKFITVVLFALLSVAYAEIDDNVYELNKILDNTDDYISLQNQQFNDVLDGFYAKLQAFEEKYYGRLETEVINSKFISDAVHNFNEQIYPFEFLSNKAKDCVYKYRKNIQSVEKTISEINYCHEEYKAKLNPLLTEAYKTASSLQGYIGKYNQDVNNCVHQDQTSHTNCLIAVTNDIKILINRAVKGFQSQIEGAICTSDVYFKDVIYCSYGIEQRTVSLLAGTGLQIKTCVFDKVQCPPCQSNTCSESYSLSVHPTNETIVNPFFGRPIVPQCILLKK